MAQLSTVNIRDVASVTNLSASTVSRALRADARVAEATRLKVMEAAERLNYRRNVLLHGALSGKSMMVGVLMPMVNSYLQGLLVGIHDGLAEGRYLPVFLNSLHSPAYKSDLNQIRRLVEHRVDGIILFPRYFGLDEEEIREIWGRRLPLVVLDCEVAHVRADFVGTDDEAAGRMAAEHLLALGHRRLGHLAGPDVTSSGVLRRRGFERAVQATPGATCITEVSSTYDDADPATEPMVRRMLSGPNRPTAIFAANDLLARVVFAGAKALGVRVPQDLSVIGCGNMEWTPWMNPPLSTFDQNSVEIGFQAARMLVARLQGDAPAQLQTKRLPVTLIARETTCPPPASR